jgi:nucleoid DNA-binding protein/outer membrane biosynthesis protein TonB
MNERYNTSDLAALLASHTRLDRESAEKFIDAISDFVVKGIEANKSVKIIGLGVFKVVLVRERESVHIQTGERFVIPAHHKLSFLPDKELKDSINKPFMSIEPVEAESGHSGKDAVRIENEEYVEETDVEDIVTEVIPEPEPEIILEDASEPEIPVIPEDEIEIKQQYYDIISPIISTENENKRKTGDRKQKPENKSREPISNSQPKTFYANDGKDKSIFDRERVPLWLWFVILPLLVVTGVGIGTYAFWHFSETGKTFNSSGEITVSADVRKIQEPLPLGATLLPDSIHAGADTLNSIATDTVQQRPVASNTISMGSADSAKRKKTVTNWLASTPESKNEESKPAESKPADKPNKETERKNRELAEKRKKDEDAKKAAASAPKEKTIPKRVRMTQGSSLREIALEYYGDKVFWVYIYEHNKDIIKDYNHIPLGAEIRLPSPKTYAIDPNSQPSVEKAHKKQSELYKRNSWDDYVQ